jgi:hypothetical protein
VREGLAAIGGAQQPHEAGIGFGQRLGVGDQHRAIGAEQQLGVVLAIGGNGVATDVDHARGAPLRRRGRSRRALDHQLGIGIEPDPPQGAIRCKGGADAELRLGFARRLGCGRGHSGGGGRGLRHGFRLAMRVLRQGGGAAPGQGQSGEPQRASFL